MKKIFGWVNKWKTKIGLIAVGHGVKQIEEVLFDWLLYGVVVGYTTTMYGAVWGSLFGFLIMAPLSGLVCWLYILFYDWAKVDWFGFEAIKEYKTDLEGGGFWKRITRKILRMGDIPAFFALSIHGDPFWTTVYLRHPSQTYKGLMARDWWIFWASVLFSNAYWTLRWVVIFEVLKFLWNLVF